MPRTRCLVLNVRVDAMYTSFFKVREAGRSIVYNYAMKRPRICYPSLHKRPLC